MIRCVLTDLLLIWGRSSLYRLTSRLGFMIWLQTPTYSLQSSIDEVYFKFYLIPKYLFLMATTVSLVTSCYESASDTGIRITIERMI